MTLNQNTSPRGFLIYESTYNQLIKCFTPQQIGEFIKLAGDYILNGNKEVESDDPLVDTMLEKYVLRLTLLQEDRGTDSP